MIRLVQHTLYDRQGWGEAVEAFSILLPADWTVSGEVAWGGGPNDPTCMALVPQLIMSARSPDGLWGFEIMPGPVLNYISWTRTAPNQAPFDSLAAATEIQNRTLAEKWHTPRSFCRVSPDTTIDGLTQVVLGNLRPGARVVAREPLPHLREQLRRYLQTYPPVDPSAPDEALAFRYTIEVSTPRGPVVEELGIFATRHLTNMPSYDGFGQGVSMRGLPVYTFRYPAGRKREADPLMTAISNSLRSNPRWDAAMARHHAEINRINRQGAIDRNQIWAETSSAISDMQMEGWRSRSESSDRMTALSVDQIRGVEPLRDPTTGQEFELPNTYSTFYRNPQGEFLMSPDPNFRATDLFPYENWTRLENSAR